MRFKKARRFCYRVEGLNVDRLLNLLKKRGIPLYNVVKKSDKLLEFSLDAADVQNFFAITENLCYNIKKVREVGFFAPIIGLLRHTGVIIGVALFCLSAVVADRAVFSLDYYGDGAVYKAEAEEILERYGIKPFAFISGERLRVAETGILKESDRFSFASIKKHGSRLKINLVLSAEPGGIIDTTRKQLYTAVGGVVESIKAYRGTCVVAVGDTVAAGDVLIDGYCIVKETRVETYVLGYAVIACTYTYEYEGGEGEEQTALSLARESLPDYEIVNESCNVAQTGETYTYSVTITYRVKIK